MDEIPLDSSTAPLYPILLLLKKKIRKIQIPKNFLKINFKSKDNTKIFNNKLNKLFIFSFDTWLK
jgi:hypothetical protein